MNAVIARLIDRMVRISLVLLFLSLGASRAAAQEVIEYYSTDAAGSIRAVFAPDGTVKARSDYQPFGEEWGVTTPGGPLPTQRFTGQQRDAEEGHDNFNARTYHTRLGRMTSVDPIYAGLFEPQRWNRYVYALNNPLSYGDPTGLNGLRFYDYAETAGGINGPSGVIPISFIGLIYGPTGHEGRGSQGGYGSGRRRARVGMDDKGNVTLEEEVTVTPEVETPPAPPPPNPRTDIITIAAPTTRAVGAGTVNGLVDFTGGLAIGSLFNKVLRWLGPTVSNPVPATVARVIPEGVNATTLGRPGASDVFVTAADDISGMSGAEIARRLTIPESPTGFRIFEFPTPEGIASPILRTDPGFIGGGRTLGGAREFVIPNGPIPPGATVRIVP